jgi:hypothetical protein
MELHVSKPSGGVALAPVLYVLARIFARCPDLGNYTTAVVMPVDGLVISYLKASAPRLPFSVVVHIVVGVHHVIVTTPPLHQQLPAARVVLLRSGLGGGGEQPKGYDAAEHEQGGGEAARGALHDAF